jgi:tRNA 2-thiouridine synthesizing protein B
MRVSMILHLVNQSPQQAQALHLCLRFATSDDIVLLLEDGVTAAVSGSAGATLLQTSPCRRIVAVQADVASRGGADRLAPGVQLIGYDEFVALCCECDKVQSWF